MALPALASGPVEGNPSSAVRVVSYESLQCSDCTKYRKMLDEHLLPRYGARVAFEHRDFPLARHQWSKRAAIAARWFDSLEPALGVEFRRWALNNIGTITAEDFTARLAAWAEERGTGGKQAVASLSDAKLAKAVDEDRAEGIARGISRTPTVFVNGEPFIETFTLEEILKAIDGALAAVNK
jgi:protein-disulfide isomerase